MVEHICLFVIGIAFTLVGCFAKNFTYAKSLQSAVGSNRRAPTWLGRILFLTFGLSLLTISIWYLFIE